MGRSTRDTKKIIGQRVYGDSETTSELVRSLAARQLRAGQTGKSRRAARCGRARRRRPRSANLKRTADLLA